MQKWSKLPTPMSAQGVSAKEETTGMVLLGQRQPLLQ